jgi:hypothetical protein
MTKPDEIAIQSLGAPPERHADRVIAAMLRLLAQRRAPITKAITEARRASKDGGVRAQQHMAERIRRAGAIKVSLKSGTRGRYRMLIFELVGSDHRCGNPHRRPTATQAAARSHSHQHHQPRPRAQHEGVSVRHSPLSRPLRDAL